MNAVGVLLIAMVAACTSSTRAPHRRAEPARVTLPQAGPGGQVSLPVAERLFTTLVAPLPGVPASAGTPSVSLDATPALIWLYQDRQELSAAQRAVLDKAVSYRGDACTDAPLAPGQPTPGSSPPIGPPLAPVPHWMAGVVDDARDYFEGELGRSLPGSICIQSSAPPDTKTSVGFADAEPLPTGHRGSVHVFGDDYGGCVIRLMPRWFPLDRDDEIRAVAHEVFHCFQFSLHNKPLQYFTPGWVLEAQASWAADQYAEAESLPPAGYEVGDWNQYLSGQFPLFALTYGADGFYSTLQADGQDIWRKLDQMLSVFETALPCPAGSCLGGAAQGNDDAVAASKAAFDVAGGNDPKVIDTYLPPETMSLPLGAEWKLSASAISSQATPHRQSADTLDVDDTVLVDQGGGSSTIHSISLNAPVVEIDPTGLVGAVRMPDGTTQPLSTMAPTVFCTTSICPSDCPGYDDLQIMGGDTLVLAATTVDQYASGVSPSNFVAAVIGYAGCPPRMTSPPPTPPPGGAGGSGCSGNASGCGGCFVSSAACDGTGEPCAGGDCGVSWGDPHLVTYDRRSYDFQAVGEFIATADPTGHFGIQVRQQRLRGSQTVALNTAVASDVAGGRVEVRADAARFTVLLNGAAWSGSHAAVGVGGLVRRGGTTERPALREYWPDGSRAWITTLGTGALSVAVQPSVQRGPRLIGLLGSADGNPDNDIAVQGEAARPGPIQPAQLYPGFADSWRITARTSLFTYAPGTSTATYTDRGFPRGVLTAATVPGHEAARRTCRTAGIVSQPFLDDCTLDVAVGKSSAYATATIAAQHNAAPATPVTEPIKTVEVAVGTPTTKYPMTLWATDELTDCAAHAYGRVADFLAAHPCRHATRYVWSVLFHGATLAVSAVTVDMASAGDGATAARSLAHLGDTDGGGAVAGLPRDGHLLPDFALHRVPADAVSATVTRGSRITFLNAWYIGQSATPPTDPHDPAIGHFMTELSCTSAAAVHE